MFRIVVILLILFILCFYVFSILYIFVFDLFDFLHFRDCIVGGDDGGCGTELPRCTNQPLTFIGVQPAKINAYVPMDVGMFHDNTYAAINRFALWYMTVLKASSWKDQGRRWSSGFWRVVENIAGRSITRRTRRHTAWCIFGYRMLCRSGRPRLIFSTVGTSTVGLRTPTAKIRQTRLGACN